jgi:hypothetical protein
MFCCCCFFFWEYLRSEWIRYPLKYLYRLQSPKKRYGVKTCKTIILAIISANTSDAYFNISSNISKLLICFFPQCLAFLFSLVQDPSLSPTVKRRVIFKKNKLRGVSPRPSDRSLSAKLVPTFSEKIHIQYIIIAWLLLYVKCTTHAQFHCNYNHSSLLREVSNKQFFSIWC